MVYACLVWAGRLCWTRRADFPGRLLLGTDILEKPIRFVVETEEGSKVYQALPQLEEQTPAQVKGYWKAEDAELCVSFKGRMEFDGWMNYVYTLTPKRNLHIKDVRLEIPVNSSVGTGFLGSRSSRSGNSGMV